MPTERPVQEFAPAKINLSLHVTGRRSDGYHLLDSLVVFADVGDHLQVTTASETRVSVTGPRADGVPADARNLVWKAADHFGQPADITLYKHLPAAAGIGGGSSDAAAVLRALAQATGRSIPPGTDRLGADLPVCIAPQAARMQGVGELITPLPPLPAIHAVLVNPGVEVATPKVFAALRSADNPPMFETLPQWPDAATLAQWLRGTRNDLEPPSVILAPVIGDVLTRLRREPECLLARMSGSGATCFALTTTRARAEAMAGRIAVPGWWVQPVTLT